jgi:threonine/homoserine/homoserine lactone efflux protein
MDWLILPKGMLLGLSIAAPVGPIGVLTIRRTIGDGFRMGFATGLGAATADATYGLVAAFGLTAIMSVLTDHADLIRLIGGLMLLVIGLRGIWHGRSTVRTDEAVVRRSMTPTGSYAQTIGLTLTNPMTIVAFIGMFAGVGISPGEGRLVSALALVVGVGLGSAAWWLLLAYTVSRIRHRLPDGAMRFINIGSSTVIVAFGVAALIAAR